jgi:hypothetical protein
MTVLVGRVTGARVLGRDVPDGQRRAWELHGVSFDSLPSSGR